jgi:hypothetical protein
MCRLMVVWVSVLCVGTGCGASHDATRATRAQTSAAHQVAPNLPSPCKNAKAFMRAVRRLANRPGVEISPTARRALRVVARNGAANCHSASYVDLIRAIPTK